MNKKILIVLGALCLAIIVGVGVGALILLSSKNKPNTAELNPTNSKVSPAVTQVAPPTGKLEIVKKTLTTGSLDFDVVYADTQPVANTQGFALHLFVTPTSINLADSQVQAGTPFGKGNFKVYLQSVKKVGDQIEITLYTAKSNSAFNLTLQTGDAIASVHLAAAKKGDYKIAFDNTQTKVLNGGNDGSINNVIGNYVDATLSLE